MNAKTTVAFTMILALAIGGVYKTYGSGTLVIKMTDPPVDWGPVDAVYISYSDIMIHRADAGDESGWASTGVSGTNLNLAEAIDAYKTVGNAYLQAGLYNVVRFTVTGAKVTYEGADYTVVVENGKLNVPIVPAGVRVTAGQTTSMLIDISVKVTGSVGDFKLVPAATATPQ